MAEEKTDAVTTPNVSVGDLESLIVDGREERLTREQLRAEAQKARGVLPKLQSEHDKLKAEHEELSNQAELMGRFIGDFEQVLKGGDEGRTALQRMSKAIGVKPAQLVEQIRASIIDEAEDEQSRRMARSPKRRTVVEEEDSDEDLFDDREEARKPTSTAQRHALSLEDLDPELQRDLAFARKSRLGTLRSSLHSDLQSVFDGDAVLHKIAESDAKKAKMIARLGQTALQRRVNLENAEPNARLYREIATEVKALLEDLGVTATSDEKPKVSLEALGLGESGFDGSLEELHQEQPPERVSMSSGNYRRNFASRLLHRIVKAGGLAPSTAEE